MSVGGVSTALALILLTSVTVVSCEDGPPTPTAATPPSPTYVGCFKDNPHDDNRDLPQEYKGRGIASSVDACVQQCLSYYHSYAGLQGGVHCFCGGKYGSFGSANESECNIPCAENRHQFCGGESRSSIYDTGQRGPGPPSNVEVSNISETGLHLQWQTPEVRNDFLRSYTVVAEVVKTFSRFRLPPTMSWTYTTDVLRSDLLDLHPGSQYLISVRAVTDQGSGVPANVTVQTLVGNPVTPDEPIILEKHPELGQVLVKIDEGVSDNGPISGYQIVVICGLAEFDPDLLDSYYNADKKGLSYYITAELDSRAGNSNFTVGDGRRYGKYDNVRLPETCEDVQLAVGVMSSLNSKTCISYSHLHSEESIIISSPELREKGLESWLIAAIVVLSVLLVLVIIAYFAARHFAPQRRGASRMEDPQEMCLQGPMIEVENYAYLPEEEEENRVDHYDRLKKILWDIPRNFLDLQPTTVLGRGEFGTFMKGTVLQNGYPTPASVYSIEDGQLSSTTKRSMLQELAVLIKCGTEKHSNVIRLIGTCESPEMLYVVLEHHPATLKDILLESRTLERPNHDRNLSSVCSLPQQAFLQIGIGIAQGMAHLSNNKVIHKQLAACSVLMADGMVPKIANFGIAKCNRPNVVSDFTRWTAREVFRSQHYTVKSDVWSMGCLLWEMSALGGTPYNSIPTIEVPTRVMRGLRPPQLSHVSDDFYQLMLQCWQLDLDERPHFHEITATLCELINSNETQLDWSIVPGFYYEQYVSEHEVVQQR